MLCICTVIEISREVVPPSYGEQTYQQVIFAQVLEAVNEMRTQYDTVDHSDEETDEKWRPLLLNLGLLYKLQRIHDSNAESW